jgi:hypothetical protein
MVGSMRVTQTQVAVQLKVAIARNLGKKRSRGGQAG